MKTQDFAKHLQETGHFNTILVRQNLRFSPSLLAKLENYKISYLEHFPFKSTFSRISLSIHLII